jgi:hypothetical protein
MLHEFLSFRQEVTLQSWIYRMDEAREPVIFVLVPHGILGRNVFRVERYVLFHRL